MTYYGNRSDMGLYTGRNGLYTGRHGLYAGPKYKADNFSPSRLPVIA